MMRTTGLALASLALGFLMGPAAQADVLPSRRTETSLETRKVAGRMAQVGIPSVEVGSQVTGLSSQDLGYFARGEGRVQVVAGLWGEEWVFGSLWLGLISIIALTVGHKTKK